MSKEVFDFLAAYRPFYLATVEGAAPKVRPMGFVMWHEDKVWLGMGDHKNVYKQIKASPKIEVVATNPDGQWIRVSGSLQFDDRPELFQKAVEAMPMLKDIYAPGGPKMATGFIKDGQAEFKDMAGNTTKTVKL
jgi:uncharacterized pyridoxamine 5'-phosphate oxidase family protein